MPSVAIVDVLRDPFDYRYRLVGTKLVEKMGGERTGLRMREIFTPDAVEATEHLIATQISTRAPIACEGGMPWLSNDYRQFQSIILPLAEDGMTVDKPIMGFHFVK